MEVHRNPDGTIDPHQIDVHPDNELVSDGFVALSFGHELVHVRDLIDNPFELDSTEHLESEIRGYKWAQEHVGKFGLSPNQQGAAWSEWQGIIDDYRQEILNRQRMESILREMTGR